MKGWMNEKDRTHNKRFYESGGVTPPKHLCEFASASPAATAVTPAFIKPPDVICQAGTAQCDLESKKLDKKNEISQ